MGARGGCREACPLQQAGSLDRLRGHLERIPEEAGRLLLGAQGHRPVAGRAERDPGLAGKGVGLRALGGVPERRQVVHREGARQLLVHERLEVAGGSQVARLAIAPSKGRVRDLADQRLDERELAALGGPRIQVADDQLATGQPNQSTLRITGIDGGDGREPVDRERMAQHRRRLEHGPVGRVQRVEACRDERLQGIGDGQVSQVADRPVDAAGHLERALGNEHPDDLDRVQGNAVGPDDDAPRRVVGKPGHQAGQELVHRRRATTVRARDW